MPETKTRNAKKAPQVNLEALGLEMGNKPPQALDVEKAVLGAMLLEPSCIDMVIEELSPECFYDPRHRTIYEAMLELVAAHNPIDIITVSERLVALGRLEEVGGPVVLTDLSENVGSAAHVEFYVKILKQKAIQRDLITASHEIIHDSYDESIDVDKLVDSAQSKIYRAIDNNVKKDVQEIGSIINEAMASIQEMQTSTGVNGVPSGFAKLDRITMGWQKSDLIILAARPSVGKTAFALNLARNAAVDHNMPVAFFSLEMSNIQLAKRLMTTETGLSADKIKGGVKLEPFEWQQMEYKLKGLSKAPLYIDDTPSLPVTEFRTKVKALVKNKGVRLVIVDYLQLMQSPSDLKNGMREQEVAAISRNLKATAKELNVPIIALSQLSRQAVQRTGGSGKPQLSDLRESGSIEQDADMVLFIHRPDYIGLSEDPADKEKTQIIIAKHRNGETGEIEMLFKGEKVKFVELEDTLAAHAMNDVVPFAGNDSEDDPFNSIGPANEF